MHSLVRCVVDGRISHRFVPSQTAKTKRSDSTIHLAKRQRISPEPPPHPPNLKNTEKNPEKHTKTAPQPKDDQKTRKNPKKT
ncbi:hypothetical protein PGT21_012228 [Puccinia graminis f. sp. tritici]|uniref:Uncharacterized protein n=1 Tax=Puccinia graminis f. sp. tritici TaxID=56615 RepID=A0A5B0NMZ6_PUCGR|nr:hypothetical protein PGT21_011105 [Puccinia graminis f. sp. tritici]KAA1089268.1 hypothetical protein PGT21_012228 [Puccinia graminis f. sp. tritici]